MLNKNDLKYILKKVIIFLIIALIFMLIGKTKASASVLPRPSQANLQMNDNGTTRYLTNTNVNQTFSISLNSTDYRFYKLISTSHVNISTITHVNVTYNPRLNGPFYSEFYFFVGGGYTLNSGPLLNLTAVYSYDDQTHNYTLCDIDPFGNSIEGTIYKIRCFSNEALQQYSFNFNCTEGTSCNTTSPDYDIGIELMGYYTTDMQDAQTIQAISNLQQELINNQMNMNNQNIDSNEFISNLNDVTNSFGITNNTITNLIILPITLLNAFNNNWNAVGTCQRIDLGTLFGTHLYLPCINLSNYLGSTLWVTIDCLMSGFLILSIAKKFINVFDDLTNLRTNQVDELYGGGS